MESKIISNNIEIPKVIIIRYFPPLDLAGLNILYSLIQSHSFNLIFFKIYN